MLRRSEAANLTWGDLVEQEDGTGRLTIARSKTDWEGEGAVLFVSAVTMEALRAIGPVEVDDADSLFGLSAEQIGRRISSAAAAAGLGEGLRSLCPSRDGPGPGAVRHRAACSHDCWKMAVTDDARQIYSRRASRPRGDCKVLRLEMSATDSSNGTGSRALFKEG